MTQLTSISLITNNRHKQIQNREQYEKACTQALRKEAHNNV